MKLKLVTAFLVMCMLSMVSLAMAAENKSGVDQVYQMDEIVVTSTRTERSVLDTPSNISVITSRDLKEMDAKNIAEALKKLPGVYYTNASGLEPKISLRGTRIGMSGGALVLLNGIPINLGKFGYTDFEAIPLEDIERIEVVKGPISALYGGDSARGVINIITKRGKTPVNGKLAIIAGSYNDQRYSGLFYGAKGKFDYNLYAKKREQDGYREDTSLDNYYFNGEVGYWFTDNTRLGLYLNFADKNRDLAKRLTEEQRKDDPKQAPDYSDTENTDVITGINLDSKTALFDFHTTLYYKYRDKTYENYKKAVLGTPYEEDLGEDVFGARTILTYKKPIFNLANRLSVGIDFDHDRIDVTKTNAASKTPDAPYTIPDPKKSGVFTRQELGVFIQDELSLLPNLTLTAGVRYDNFRFDNDADYDFSQNGLYDYDETPSYDRWNPRVSINYQPIKNLGIYGSLSQSYRAPNIYDYYYTGYYAAKNDYTLEPETFTQYEAGIRYSLSPWFNIDTSLFRIEIDDMLDSTYDDTGKYMGKQNISEVTIKGFELALSGEPFEWLRYKIGYSYTDARYSDDVLTKVDRTTVVNINDKRLTKIPYNKLSIDLNTRLFKKGQSEMWWYVNVFAQDKYPMDKANTEYYPGYALVNTKLRLKLKLFEAFIAVDNVLDKDYDGYAYSSYGNNYYYPAYDRTFSAGFSYRF